MIGGLHLRDNAGERSIAQTIFGKRQDLGVLTALGIENIVRPETDLLKARRIKVEARHCPEDGKTGFRANALRDPRGGQGGAGIVGEARRRGRDFMRSRAIETLVGQTFVQLGQSESQGWPARDAGIR